MALADLYTALADALDDSVPIERAAATGLRGGAASARLTDPPAVLPPTVSDALSAPDAHPVCKLILAQPLPWAPPQTSQDPTYAAHSTNKVHVELLGPEGLAPSQTLRVGLYGIEPHAHYGVRTHPAEEIFVMLAGQALWKRGNGGYTPHGPGDRSYHPSMLPHGTKTADQAFLSVYVWRGDISTKDYVYHGREDA